ncbi:hypothetical protein [Amycolatopsis sp. FDAARGOS 1241]|uniref:hypothetical protein n=1 Tax=Amycolatopsis sp. FDAARGOS 1241 TaxID=2778070 RepID=UPI001EF18CF3|nr:hypothetical protein [Amycolatopsis sp. FDAARGOS 1241]
MPHELRFTRRAVFTAAFAGLVATACGAQPRRVPVAAPPPPPPPATPTPTSPPPPPPNPLTTSLLVGFCGAPHAKALGEMTGDLAAAGRKLVARAATFPKDRPVTPVVELIAATAHPAPTGCTGHALPTRRSSSTSPRLGC